MASVRRPAKRVRRVLCRLVVVFAAVLLPVAASLAAVLALFGAATLTSTPAAFLSEGAVAFAAVAGAGLWWLARRGTHGRGACGGEAFVRGRPVLLAVAVAGLAVAVMGFAFAALPLGACAEPAAAVAGQQYWHLSTGSTLRYVKVPAHGPPRPAPVVFVHGGPGTPDMKGNSAYFGQLADDGFDVYVYDGLGSGNSTRLASVSGYSPGLDVADLEAARREIGAGQLILIGDSYGATVVAGYLAAHPEHVARAVFSSPASLDPSDRSGGNITSRLDAGDLRTLYAYLLQPRNMLVYGLLQVNADAAHSLAGDAEMDARNDRVFHMTAPALHCDRRETRDTPTGMGFYRLQYPQSRGAPPAGDLRPALQGITTPALVVKGSCDYLSWSSAMTYIDALPNSTLVYLRGGHSPYQDVPREYLAAVRAFLVGAPVPDEMAPTAKPPPGYEGPAG